MKGIYIHIPFCDYKCNYCDFSTMTKQYNRVDEYFRLLQKEITIYKNPNEKIDTIYIGGGTPNLVDSKYIKKIYTLLNKCFDLQIKEFTIECNPEFVTKEKIESYKSIGVDRISLGVQSFNDEYNRFLGRGHKVTDVLKSFDIIKHYIDNISIDLIFGFPNQTLESLDNDLNYIRKLAPNHVSWYNMILEPGTKFYKDYEDINRNDDIEYEMYVKICKGLEDYNHYEISNFAKDDFESKHNKIYWKDENYYGFGLSSSGYINQKRYTNEFFYPNYKRKIINEQKPINFSENINLEKREFEFIITNMRLKEGLDLTEYNRKFDIDLYKNNKNMIDKWIKERLLTLENNHLSFTNQGFFVSNTFFIDILV
ncbi:radical SAM family heme chaperone HemW [Finegoldia magna]|uniref:radical SAM family heme chaperone HemW n=1 Tax=Finegoldia magna TaxID=1260 RepID=UPI0012B0AAED|nr:radical SAM family heme chaperone HemW [Finegoldia magna]MSB16705.1 radical SAM family heme chaperone HemW [Finegoldia magna]MSD45511.1 radical SAM family heme chaperone HemW [Finegoldia magna]